MKTAINMNDKTTTQKLLQLIKVKIIGVAKIQKRNPTNIIFPNISTIHLTLLLWGSET